MHILAKQRLGLSAMDFDQKLQFVERRVRKRLGFQAFNLMRESQSEKLMRERKGLQFKFDEREKEARV